MREAISYRRFSSGKQDKGDSKRRQDSAFTWFCQVHKLTPVETLLDAGLSGFHAVHKSKGNFGIFLERIKQGKVKAGTVLVIEAWDRFSRERPDKALATLVEILEAGIAVGVYNLDLILTEADLDTPKMQMVYSDMIRARQESKRKSEMSKAAKVARIENRQVRTTVCPSWLVPVVKVGANVSKENFKLHPEIAPLLKKAITWAIEGHGGNTIRQRIGKVFVNVPKSDKYPDGKKPALVGLSEIFRQRTLIGEYQDYRRKDRIRKEKVGEPIQGYYPALISEKTFYELQAALDNRRHLRGQVGAYVTNLFSQMLYSASGNLLWVKGSPQANKTYYYLVEKERVYNLAAPTMSSFRYELLENAVLNCLWEIDLTPTVKSNAEQDALEGKIADYSHKIGEINARLLESGGQVDTLLSALQVLDKARKNAQDKLEQIKKENISTDQERMNEARGIAQLLASTQGQDKLDLRAKLRGIISSLLQRIDVNAKSTSEAELVLTFKCGLQRGIWVKGDEIGLFIPNAFMQGNATVSLKDLQLIRNAS